MAALIGLSTAIFAKTSYKNWTLSRFPRPGILLSGGSLSFKKVDFDHRLILFRPLGASPPLVCRSEVVTSVESAVPGNDNAESTNTVRVRFQLQEECKYGDKFFLVGNDPALGLWDPSSAIPLSWFDGNMWTVDLDLLVDSTIGFKFILIQSTGEVIWQPGPDRILKTWESMNTIVVTEDWETAEEQEIMEEETMNPDLEPALDESNSLRNEDLMDNVDKDAVFVGNNHAHAADNVSLNNESVSTGNVAAHPAETSEIMKDEGSVSNRKEMLTNNKTKDERSVSNREEMLTNLMLTNNNRSSLPGNNSMTAPDDEEGDALVPGNNSVTEPDQCPLQAASTEEVCTKEVESIIGDAQHGNDAVKD